MRHCENAGWLGLGNAVTQPSLPWVACGIPSHSCIAAPAPTTQHIVGFSATPPPQSRLALDMFGDPPVFQRQRDGEHPMLYEPDSSTAGRETFVANCDLRKAQAPKMSSAGHHHKPRLRTHLLRRIHRNLSQRRRSRRPPPNLLHLPGLAPRPRLRQMLHPHHFCRNRL